MSIVGPGFKPTVSPYFGWSRQKPPQNYRIALSRGDFSDMGTLTPSAALVRRIADNLVGEKDSTPRFTLLTNTLPLLGNETRVRAFENQLLRAVVADLEQRYPQAVPPLVVSGENWEKNKQYFPEADFSGDTVRIVPDESGKEPLEGYGFVKEPHPETGKKQKVSSYKALHADGQLARIFSLCYGPCQNVRGGSPRVADVRQYRRDHDLSVDDVSTESRIGIREEHLKRLMDEYTLTLKPFDATNDMPILLLNNMIEQGVLHGATRPSKKDPALPATRPIKGSGFYYYRRKAE